MFRSKKTKPFITVLDIGSSKICGFMAKTNADGKPECVGYGFAPAKGIKTGTIVNLDDATECVRSVLTQIENQAGRSVESVVVNVSSGQLKSRHLYREMPIPDGHPITATDVRHLVDGIVAAGVTADEEVLHRFPLSYSVDKEQGVADPRGLYAGKLGAHVHVVTLPETQLRNLVMVLDRCHVRIEKKVATPYATALAVLSDEEKDVGASVVDMGGGTTSIAMFLNGGLVHLGFVPCGGGNLTRDIAQGLSTSLTEAERIKTLNGRAFLSPKDELTRVIVPLIGEEDGVNVQVPKSELIQIIVPRIEEILERVGQILCEKDPFTVATYRLVLSGGGAELQGIKEKTEKVLEANVRLAKTNFIKNLPNQFDSYTFTVCVGLLRYALASVTRNDTGRFEQQIKQNGRLGKVLQWLTKNF